MKKTILLLLAALLWQAGIAQGESPVILVSSSGKVIYQSPGVKSKQTLIDGAVMKRTGVVQLKKRSSALLLYNRNFRQVEGKNKYALATLFPDAQDGTFGLSFDIAFSDYLMSAIQLAASAENAGDAWGAVRTGSGSGDGWGAVRTGSGSGDGWGAVRTGSGSGDGWGGRGTQIRAIQPFGKVIPANVTLRWSRPSGDRTYKVAIRDMSSMMVVLETTTTDTFWTVDLNLPHFTTGKTFQWSVSSKDSPMIASNQLKFEIGTQADRTDAIAQALEAPSYAQSSASVQKLMQAVSLEDNDYFEEAIKSYQAVQNENPRSEIIRLMHAAFWMRYGLKQMALKAYGGN